MEDSGDAEPPREGASGGPRGSGPCGGRSTLREAKQLNSQPESGTSEGAVMRKGLMTGEEKTMEEL